VPAGAGIWQNAAVAAARPIALARIRVVLIKTLQSTAFQNTKDNRGTEIRKVLESVRGGLAHQPHRFRPSVKVHRLKAGEKPMMISVGAVNETRNLELSAVGEI
jgi:hypothetical protein